MFKVIATSERVTCYKRIYWTDFTTLQTEA